ncbi:MAG: hypothetical protein KTR28_08150, partial [Micavibrio sp.]|nr:hypothetical protein [Micavibrio sp.]
MSLLKKIFPIDDLIATAQRFPLSVVSALLLFIVAVLEIHDAWDIDEDLLARFATVLGCSYFWFGG